METFEESIKCCTWQTTSIKYGIWKYYNENGELINQKDETIDLVNNPRYREITEGLKGEMNR
ncbi:MAG TPA: hypothetical protein PK147_11875 [Saprospiraceae bacterium]|nr:hypothetical protein [Saprospiraceae bacterium]